MSSRDSLRSMSGVVVRNMSSVTKIDPTFRDPLQHQQTVKRFKKHSSAERRFSSAAFKRSFVQQCEEEEFAHQILNTELDEEIDDMNFKERESSGSCKVADIQNILFGGVSSRFWMLRKHINMLSDAELKALPFYSW